MVSHQLTESNVTTVRASRGPTAAPRGAGIGGEMRELDSIYQSHSIPSMPSRLLGSQQRPLGDSMLAYSERMREISRFRKDSAFVAGESAPGGTGTVLEVQARHIPRSNLAQAAGKNGKSSSQIVAKPRRPMSLDELMGRQQKKADQAANSTNPGSKHQHKGRPLSEPPVLEKPSVRIPTGGSVTARAENSEGGEDPGKRIRISFVSAADLFDLVDFSIRSKKSRNESIKLTRTEDTLRLINEANFFRSMPARLSAKPGEDDEVDRASLLVQGSSSPRDSQGGDSTRGKAWTTTSTGNATTTAKWSSGGDWARRGTRGLSDPYDSDDEGAEWDNDRDDDGDDEDDDFKMDLLRQRYLLLSQPQKLRVRPKRAKRMKLHTSRLSAIPEDERHKQDAHSTANVQKQGQTQPQERGQANEQTLLQTPAQGQTQDVFPATRLPVMPSPSSLAAIKSSRRNDANKAPNSSETWQSPQGVDNAHGSEDSFFRNHHHQSNEDATDTEKLNKNHKKKGAASPRDTGLRIMLPEPVSKRRHSLQDDGSSVLARKHDSQRKAGGHGRGAGVVNQAMLSGQSLVLETPSPRAKAQKKFRKLIFLRDQPEQIYHRYS